MSVAVSSLSLAIQGIADFLDSQFGPEVAITVTTPQRAAEIAKGSTSAHCLNIFVYRIAPSGFHAAAGMDETQFIRVNALITPFPADIGTAPEDIDLRILGHTLRVLQSSPVLPVLPGAALADPPGRKDYRLQAILLAPAPEEINHIWTTQGADLAYRLSAVYEFALIPIEPLAPRVAAAPPRTLMIDTGASMAGAAAGFVPASNDSRALPLGDKPGWLPVQMLVSGDLLVNSLAVAPTATEVPIALAGPVGESAWFSVIWTLANGTTQTQAPQVLPIGAALLDAPAARAVLPLSVPATAKSAVIRASAAPPGPTPDAIPYGNTLTLNVT